MNVGELKDQIQNFQAENLLKSQTVEMIFNSKKHFFSGLSKSNNEAIILIKRKDYQPYSVNDLKILLSEFNNQTQLFLAPEENSSSKTAIKNCFLTDCFLELEA